MKNTKHLCIEDVKRRVRDIRKLVKSDMEAADSKTAELLTDFARYAAHYGKYPLFDPRHLMDLPELAKEVSKAAKAVRPYY